MRVMYIMPRYHTNLLSTVRGWIENGDDVCIVTHTKGMVEDYSLASPIIADYSKVFKVMMWLYMNSLGKRRPYAKDLALRLGFPSYARIRRIVKEYKPDIVILREKSLYSIVCTLVCRKLSVKTVIYNQSPVWVSKKKNRKDVLHRLVDSLTPPKRITPVYDNLLDNDEKALDENAYFAPFVMKGNKAPCDKSYFWGDKINILEIGKYEERKNHFMMVDVFERLLKINQDLRLTIVGERSNDFHKKYYADLVKYVQSKNLTEFILLKYNLSQHDISEEYGKADIFVLASTREPAAISPIEAMSYSIPVITSSGNGTADYVLNGKCGFVFKDMDSGDLYEKLRQLVVSRTTIKDFGKNAYDRVCQYCSFEQYHDAIVKLMGED